MIHSTKYYQYWLFWCQWWSDHQDQEVFWGKWALEALEAVEASEVAEVTEINEAGEVSKAWKITTVDFRVFQVLEFNHFRTNITFFWCFEKTNFLTESWKLMLNFSIFFCRRMLRPCEVKKVSNSGSSINFHYSGSHWASVFGKFVKTSGQARSLFFVNS